MNGKMVYTFNSGFRLSVPAQVAGEEISRIRERRGRFFQTSDVVESARSPKSPLHQEFEWNDKRAADSYRLEQAGYIIRAIVERPHDKPDQSPVRAFVSVIPDDGEKPNYTTTAFAFSDPHLRQQVLDQAFADMRSFEKKYQQFLDLSETVATFKKAHKRATAEAKPAMAA
jgi:hypothetical protein